MVRARLVAVDAIVRDAAGHFVHNLTRDDFTLTEDGKPQTLRYLSEDEDLPLTIGLLIDTSGSQRSYFPEQRVASLTFLTAMLTRPRDKAFIVRFASDILSLQTMTANLTYLETALGRLTERSLKPGGGANGTHLFDAICATAANSFATDTPDDLGRRAIVVLTDGEDQGSRATVDQAAQCAMLGNIAVYTALYSSDDPGPQPEDDPHNVYPIHHYLHGRTLMERISRASGGRVFLVSKKLPIDHIYQLIQSDLRGQYRLAYTPSPSKPLTYHRIDLKAVDKQQKVQARIGYFTPK